MTAPVAVVVGHPVAHSRSPLIHTHWLTTYGLAGRYERLDVRPEQMPDFFARLRGGEFIGANVTLPNKELAFELADQVDEAARRIGAVNTLWHDPAEPGRILATNTDWTGWAANLDQLAPGWSGQTHTALLLGAGGAARAILFALAMRGAERILIFNRSPDRAERLAAEFAGPGLAVSGHGLEAFNALSGKADLLVNSASVGMHGSRFEGFDLAALPRSCLVTDAVYTPLVTPLLADAAARGLKTVDGLGMLLHQAAPGFARWFGTMPEVTPALRELVIRDLGL